MEITLRIDKGGVLAEVAQATAYTGAKATGGDVEETFKRISTVDEDDSELARFWDESRADICQELIGLVAEEGETGAGGDYELRLRVSNSFDEALLESMEISLFSYFVQSIASKWYVYTNKEEAGAYADKAQTLLDDIHRKAVYKKRPTRPVY